MGVGFWLKTNGLLFTVSNVNLSINNVDDIEKEIYSNSTIEERYPRENKHSIDPIKTILAKKYLEEIEQQGRQGKNLCMDYMKEYIG